MRIRLTLFLLAASLVAALPATGQTPASALTTAPATTQSTTTPTTIPTTEPAPRTAVETSELSARLTAAAAEVRAIDADIRRSAALPEYARLIDALPSDIDGRVDDAQRTLAGQPAADTLVEAQRGLAKLYEQVSDWNRDLADRNRWFDQALQRLETVTQVVQAQLAVARSRGVPPEIGQRAQALLATIQESVVRGTDGRERVLAWRDKVGQQDAKLQQVLADIKTARETAVSRLLYRDQPAVWDTRAAPAGQQIVADTQNSVRGQIATLGAYVRAHTANAGGQALIALGVIFALRAVRRRVDRWMTEEPDVRQAMSVFSHPLATGLLVTLLVSNWVYPDAPRLFWAIVGAAMLIPAMFLLRKLLERHFYPVLTALVVFYFVDQLRLVTRSQPVLTRRIFLAEMLAAAVFLLWFVRSGRLTHVVGARLGLPAPGQGMEKTTAIGSASPEPVKPGRLTPAVTPAGGRQIGLIVRLATHAAGIIFTLAFLAGVVGFQGLANLIGQATLASAYVACIFYAAMRVLQGFALAALRARPLTLLRAVQRQRRLIYARFCWALQWAVLAAWLLLTLELFSVRALVLGWLETFFTTPVTMGSLHVSLSGIVAFVAAVWGSFLLSRFVRFILEQDVFPHLNLNRGLPYAISTTLHYVILLVGFFMALAITGADLTKFAILASAFGVGLGFGLQTIFNNFISGLILLFERPIKLGDVIQLDDAGAVVGTVNRIGIRASIMRTSAGADIIVPNGLLISSRVTNWTLADRRRILSLSVSVVAGTDPAQVVGLLENVARNHVGVDKSPPPQVILTNFSAEALTFELRAWAEGYEEWTRVRSEMSLEIVRELKQAGIVMK